MSHGLDELALSQPGIESTHGRVHCPSEKVQAMLEDHQHKKQASKKQALMKAKHCEELAKKCEQVSKAMEQGSDKAMATARTNAVLTMQPLTPDNVFSSRLVVSNNTSLTRVALSLPLIAHKGNVPPMPTLASRTVNPAPKEVAGMIPPCIHALMPAQSINLWQLKHKKVVWNIDSLSMTGDFIPKNPPDFLKRVRDCTPTPSSQALPHNSEQNMLGNNEKPGNILYHADDIPATIKCQHRAIILSDNDEEDDGVSDVKLKDLLSDPSALSLGMLTISMAPSSTVAPTTCNMAVSVKSSTKGQPKASDYDQATRLVLQTAIEIYCALLLNNDLFPSALKELVWAKTAWLSMCHHHAVEMDHDTTLLKLITVRSTHLQGHFKARARPIVATTYGFEPRADKAMQEKNRALVSDLKLDSAFIFHTCSAFLDEHTGLYANPTIQQLINEVLFKNKNDDSLRWGKYYSPFPHTGFALVLTTIKCAIDEWASGMCEMISFKEDNYSGVFSSHLASLNEFNETTSSYQLLPNLLAHVYANGSMHAGVAVPTVMAGKEKKVIPNCAFMNALCEHHVMESTIKKEDNGVDMEQDEDMGLVQEEDMELELEQQYDNIDNIDDVDIM